MMCDCKYNDDTNTPQQLGGTLELLKSSRSMAGPETAPSPAIGPGQPAGTYAGRSR